MILSEEGITKVLIRLLVCAGLPLYLVGPGDRFSYVKAHACYISINFDREGQIFSIQVTHNKSLIDHCLSRKS